VLIFCDFCGFISVAYTTLNKLPIVIMYFLLWNIISCSRSRN